MDCQVQPMVAWWTASTCYRPLWGNCTGFPSRVWRQTLWTFAVSRKLTLDERSASFPLPWAAPPSRRMACCRPMLWAALHQPTSPLSSLCHPFVHYWTLGHALQRPLLPVLAPLQSSPAETSAWAYMITLRVYSRPSNFLELHCSWSTIHLERVANGTSQFFNIASKACTSGHSCKDDIYILSYFPKVLGLQGCGLDLLIARSSVASPGHSHYGLCLHSFDLQLVKQLMGLPLNIFKGLDSLYSRSLFTRLKQPLSTIAVLVFKAFDISSISSRSTTTFPSSFNVYNFLSAAPFSTNLKTRTASKKSWLRPGAQLQQPTQALALPPPHMTPVASGDNPTSKASSNSFSSKLLMSAMNLVPGHFPRRTSTVFVQGLPMATSFESFSIQPCNSQCNPFKPMSCSHTGFPNVT